MQYEAHVVRLNEDGPDEPRRRAMRQEVGLEIVEHPAGQELGAGGAPVSNGHPRLPDQQHRVVRELEQRVLERRSDRV
jgi:hypothetical protein